MRKLLAVLASVALLALAGCGGDEKKTGTTASQPTPTTPASAPAGLVTTETVVSCIPAKGEALKLVAERSTGNLTLKGVDSSKYETVAVDDEDGLVAQVLVFSSVADAGAAFEQIAKNGFFDDVRPRGNAIIVLRGGDEEQAEAIASCLPAG